MARSTVGETLQRLRRQLSGGHRLELDLLNTTVNSSTATIVLANTPPAGLRRGSTISIGTEMMRLTADPSVNTLTVMRGFMDTDPAAHTAGDEVWINPPFQPIDLLDAMIDEINSWGPSLYRVVDAAITVAGGDAVTELPATFIGTYGLIDVRRNSDMGITDADWTTWPRANVRMQRGTTTNFGSFSTSGIILRHIDGVYDGSIYVVAAMPFDTSTFTDSTDLVADVGLAASMLDLLTLGVKLRLAFDRELVNLSRMAQDEPRRSEETPPGSGLTTAQFGNAAYARRMAQEVAKLRAQYPIVYS